MNENTNDLDIQIEVRTIEIPVSEYKRLIDAESKMKMIARAFCHVRYDSDFKKFVKMILSEEIMKWTDMVKVINQEETDE